LTLEQSDANYVQAAKFIKKVLEGAPDPSARQKAMGHILQAYLTARVSAELPNYKSEYQKFLAESTEVPVDREKAQQDIRRQEDLAFKDSDPELRLIKGRRLLFEGQIDGAVAEIRQAVKSDPNRAHFYVELARALMLKPGGEKEAQDALQTAVSTMGESPRLVTMLGDSLRKQGKLDDAIAQYNRSLADPSAKNPDARISLASVYREKKDYARAQESLEKASQEVVGQPARMAAVFIELGRLFEEKGDRPKAEEQYQKALNADPEYAPPYYFYGRFLAQDSAQKEKAKTSLEEYLKREPKGEYAAEAQKLKQ
jgi:cellulose synthase operon protein C